MNRFRIFLQKHIVIHALLSVLYNRKNSKRLEFFLNADIRNVDKMISIIPKENTIGLAPICVINCLPNLGMFAFIRRVLNGIYYCNRCGFLPYVDMSDSNYYVDLNKGANPFDYFFEQPIPNILDLLDKHPMIDKYGLLGYMAENDFNNNGYFVTKEYIQAMSIVWNRFLKFKKDIHDRINDVLRHIRINDKTIGVHIRGTDFKENYNDHPVLVDPSAYCKHIEEALESGFSQIFVATDDLDILDFLVSQYGSKIVYQKDVARGRGKKGVHSGNHDKSYSNYDLGLQVILDMALLSYCGGIISGLSQVSHCARIFKRSRGEEYLYDEIINNGIVVNTNKIFW